ncbi:hypothetical protein MNBD_PLANCTO03-458 [hydrothermal vent metagenome]|uniref:Fibronectin type-III domain-containing protein n=1 Tax=hydrothermal vent metagenome TaxID=652676 RepID=A0A3B1DE69_9ZZZZ
MPLVPHSKAAAIAFFQSHIAAWSADPAAIGLSAQQVIDITTATGASQSSLLAMQEAYNTARSATATNDTDIEAMRAVGASLISTIRAYAKTTGDPSVYTKADIPAPKAPTPAGAPDAPTNVSGTINNRGAIELSWEGTLAFHTFFEVYRMFAGQTEWTLLASIGKKAFEDTTIPPSTTSAVQYFVQAKRTDLRSEPSDPVTIRMGVVGINTNAPAANNTESSGGDNLNIAA